MLKEFNHIARQMLFLHGHLTRPLDWAENASTEAATGGGKTVRRAPGAGALRIATACIACGIVTPNRFVSGQIR